MRSDIVIARVLSGVLCALAGIVGTIGFLAFLSAIMKPYGSGAAEGTAGLYAMFCGLLLISVAAMIYLMSELVLTQRRLADHFRISPAQQDASRQPPPRPTQIGPSAAPPSR